MGAGLPLALSTLFAIGGAALVAIAFSTNSWLELSVERGNLPSQQAQFPDGDINRREAFFSRTYGLFRKCFIGEAKPSATPTYKSPLGDDCIDISYSQEIKKNFTEIVKEFYHLRRTYLSLYVVGLVLALLALLFLIAGCGKRSARLLVTTGVFLFLSGSFIAGSIGVWHRVQEILFNELQHFGSENLINDEYRRSWPQIIQDQTILHYCWSYICAWVGVGCLLIGSVALCASANVLKLSKKREYMKSHSVMYASPASTYDKSVGLSPYAYLNYAYNPYATYGYNPYSYYGPYAWMYYGYGNGSTNGSTGNVNAGSYGANNAAYNGNGVHY